MAIKEDAGEILLYIYRNYVDGKTMLNTEDIVNETRWVSHKINNAIQYLEDLGAIKINKYLGNQNGVYNFTISGLNPIAVQTIESPKDFKKTFGFTVNLGLVSFSWKRENG